jgi:hypothetical protein
MKVLLTGLPHFAPRIARCLAEHSSATDRFIAVDLTTRRGRARFLLELPSADAVFCHWGTLVRSRALDLAFRLKKRVVQDWVGSDVLDALSVVESRAAHAPYIHDCVHICEAPWIRDELARLGIQAEVVPVLSVGPVAPDPKEVVEPPCFSILGYVGRDRAKFYRLPDFTQLANDFRDVQFRILGIDSAPTALPPNVQLLGWTGDIARLYRDSAVYIRVPEHDGYSCSVREALAWGRHVITSYPYPHCLVASDYESLKAHVGALKTRFEEGRLESNSGGREFVLREFDDWRVTRSVKRVLAGTA